MENRAHALAAGLFILLLGAALVASVLWFRGDHTQREDFVVVARIGVPGLTVKAPVKLRGVDIGTVESIAFDPADGRQILVRVAVDSSAPLSRGTYAQLAYQGVTGLSFIDLGDEGNDARPLAASQRIELRPSLFDQLATNGPALLANFGETARRLNTLLDTPNQERLARVLDGAERTITQFGDSARQLKPTLAALPPLLQHLDQLALRGEATLNHADAATGAAALLADELRGRLALLDHVASAAASVESAAHTFELGVVGPNGANDTPLLEQLGQAAHGFDRALGQWSEQPHSLIFGRTPPAAGPGEAGFDGTRGAQR